MIKEIRFVYFGFFKTVRICERLLVAKKLLVVFSNKLFF